MISQVWYTHLLFWCLLSISNIFFVVNSVFNQFYQLLTIDCFRSVFSFSLLLNAFIHKSDLDVLNSNLLNPLLIQDKDYAFQLYFEEMGKPFISDKQHFPPYQFYYFCKVKNKQIFSKKHKEHFDQNSEYFQVQIYIHYRYNMVYESKILIKMQELKLLFNELKNLNNDIPGLNLEKTEIIDQEQQSKIKIQQRKQVQKFLNFFSENQSYLTLKVLDILQIPQNYKKSFIDQLQNKSNNDHLSLNSIQDKKFIWPFTVKFKNYVINQDSIDSKEFIQFVFKIKSHQTNSEFEISKRFSQFELLHSQLQQEKKIKLFPLPPKLQFFSLQDKKKILKRAIQLEEHLSIILNDINCFFSVLWDFIHLPIKDIESISYHNGLSQDYYKSFSAQFYDTEIVLVKNKSKINKEQDEEIIISKRFSEFAQLHKNLKFYFQKSILPAFPSKVHYKMEERKHQLVSYINCIFQMDNIEQNYVFYRFIFEEKSNKQQKEEEKEDYINIEQEDLNIIEQQQIVNYKNQQFAILNSFDVDNLRID